MQIHVHAFQFIAIQDIPDNLNIIVYPCYFLSVITEACICLILYTLLKFLLAAVIVVCVRVCVMKSDLMS